MDWLVDKYPESMGVRDNVSTNYRILRLGTLLMYTRHHRSDHDQEIIIPQTIFIYTFSTFCSSQCNSNLFICSTAQPYPANIVDYEILDCHLVTA